MKLYPSHTLIELDLYKTEQSSKVLYDLFQSTKSDANDNYIIAAVEYDALNGQHKFRVNQKKHCCRHSNVNNHTADGQKKKKETP